MSRVTKYQEIKECKLCAWHQDWDGDDPSTTKGGDWICPNCGEVDSLHDKIGRYHLENKIVLKVAYEVSIRTEWKDD